MQEETTPIEPSPEVEAIQEEVVEQQPVEQPVEQPVAPEPETGQPLRFKVLREARERAERENAELKAQIERLKAPVQQAPAAQEDYSIAPDDLVEGRHLTQQQKKINNLEKKVHEALVENRIRSEYSDFNSVVNPENIAMLAKMRPELAISLNSNPDLYSRAVAAYNSIKTYGIHKTEEYNAAKGHIQENLAKPRPISSIPTKSSPLASANEYGKRMSKAEKAAQFRRMQETQGKF